MAAERDEKLYETLTRTGKLLKNIEPAEGETYTLESILAEFGKGGAKPAQKTAQTAAPAAPEQTPRAKRAPVETPPAPIEKPQAAPSEKPQTAPPASVPDTQGEQLRTERREHPAFAARRAKLAADKEDTKSLPNITKEMLREGQGQKTPAPPARQIRTAPPEDTTPPDRVLLKDVMHDTVSAVLEENEDGILPQKMSLPERIRSLFTHRPTRGQDTEQLWDEPDGREYVQEEPEPDSEEAAREAKRRAAGLHRRLLLGAIPAALAVVLAVLHATPWLPEVWHKTILLRSCVWGGLLLLTALLCGDVWHSALEQLKHRRFTVEAALLLPLIAVLADCAADAVTGGKGTQPLACTVCAGIWAAQWGLWLDAEGRREAFHLANLGGVPPYAASHVKTGACRQKGRLDGFYRLYDRPDPARQWQKYVLPLLLSAATVLAAVVCLSGSCMNEFLWVWSAHLAAVLPLSLPLSAALPLRRLQHRLTRGGSALAGYRGGSGLGRTKRLIVGEDDLFPLAAVAFNGYKVYGEERWKMVSYAAAVTDAAGSQLHQLFEEQLSAEGGRHVKASELRFCEEGGVTATIHGESVAMGSAYFMRKQHVTLPQDIKLQTGVFLAVDGVLGAIFVIKYQPSRNTEWALRALRRVHVRPVLAVRSGNVTPGLIKRKFSLDCHPLYPDVTTRLALSGVMAQQAETPNALLYREGLMPLAECVIGSIRLRSAVRSGTVLTYVGALAGLLLTYYLTHVGSYASISPLYLLAFLLLWLVPTLLISGLAKHF